MSNDHDHFSSNFSGAEDTSPHEDSFFRRGKVERPEPAEGMSVGTVVGDFRLQSRLGFGGMGEVWEAYQDSLSRRVAIKFVLPERVTEHHLELFAREARAGGRLSHPGIVTIYGHGETESLAWIAMELVPGAFDMGNFLDEMVRISELPPSYDRRIATFMAETAEALFAAHEAGVIHRDLKPQNILISADDRPKVTDFGLARIVDESAVSEVGDWAGTRFYMSPEQVAAKRAGIDHRTDIFSLGIVMYELLSLVRPFQGDTESQIANQILVKDPPDLRTIRSKIPRDLAVITGKALEKDRDRRYATMAELALDLRRWLANEPIRATPPTRLDRGVKWCKRNPTKSVAGALVSVTFAVILVLLSKLFAAEGELIAKTNLAQLERSRAEQKSTELASEKAKLADSYEKQKLTVAELDEERGRLSEVVKEHNATNVKLKKSTRELSENSRELERKTDALQSTVNELESKTELAERQAEELEEQSAIREGLIEDLEEQKKWAEAQTKVAISRLNDISLLFTATRFMKPLIDEANTLWPPHPEVIARYKNWLDRANLLVAGYSVEGWGREGALPSLEEFKLKLTELFELSEPVNELGVLAAAREKPGFPLLEKKREEHVWFERMFGSEAWPEEGAVRSELSAEKLPENFESLNELVFDLIGEESPLYGQEIRALLVARRAFEIASPEERAGATLTLARACIRAGQIEDALRLVNFAKPNSEGSILQGLDQVEKAALKWKGDEREKQRRYQLNLKLEIRNLEIEIGERRFISLQDSWWHKELSIFVKQLSSLLASGSGLAGDSLASKFGWGISKRIAFAEQIEERSIFGEKAIAAWREATISISESGRYKFLQLNPQIGLLPIGRDPSSGLWEFAHLMSGEPAVRGADGELHINDKTGLVFVLIPAGVIQIGTHSAKQATSIFDTFGEPTNDSEGTTVSEYFLSKYEITQGQWARIVGANPSRYSPDQFGENENHAGRSGSLMNPVEGISWLDCQLQLERMGLALPTEVQWEYGCRAGTESVFWTGDNVASLKGAANISDVYGKEEGREGLGLWEADFNDGNVVHAAVGSFRPNAFGLHDVHGNVAEWCFDSYVPYGSDLQRDPSSPRSFSNRVFRGGSFSSTGDYAGSARRNYISADRGARDLGVRPARAIQGKYEASAGK